MYIYLDDLRICPDGFKLVRTAEEALKEIRKGNVKLITLDHDLGVDEQGKERMNGYDLVKVICEEGLYVEEIYMHTDNVVGRENMYQTLLSAQRRGFISEDIKIRHYPITDNKY